MDAFAAHIGLGCGRLAGGPAESNSRRILSEALESGIRYFDTAPSYGGGASERLVASGLRGLRSEVQLCTKVGLARGTPNAVAGWRTMVLSKIRLAVPEAMLREVSQLRQNRVQKAVKPGSHGNFDVAFVHASVQQSLQELETDHLDCLLLHEPRLSDPVPELEALLQTWVSSGKIFRLGVATGSHFEDLPAFGGVAQFKIGATSPNGSPGRTLIGHGLLRGLSHSIFENCLRKSGITERIPELKRYLSEPVGASAILLNAVIYGTNIERVLVSTASPTRLRKFVSVSREIFGEIQTRGFDEHKARFGDLVRQYCLTMYPNQGVVWN